VRGVLAWAGAAVVCVLAEIATAAAVAFLLLAAQDKIGHPAPGPAPSVFTPTPVPSVFCPSGQHVTGVSASGWPDCAVNR
jgi:hypothetical protein